MKLIVKLKSDGWHVTGIGRINSLVHENKTRVPTLKDVFRALEETLDVEIPKARAPKSPPSPRTRETAGARPVDDNSPTYRKDLMTRVFPGKTKEQVRKFVGSDSRSFQRLNGKVKEAIESGRLHRKDRDLAIGGIDGFIWDY
jgi:hypothetical protein